MSTCRCCIPLTGDQRCYHPVEAMDAETVPWTVYDNEVNRNVIGGPPALGMYAEKIVNGVVISCRVTDATQGTNPSVNGLGNGCPSGACDPNALRVSNSTNGYIDFEFDATVPQPVTRVRIIDIDSFAPPAQERFEPQGTHNVFADTNTPLNSIPGGNPGGVQAVMIGPQVTYRAPGTTDERSAALTWNNIGWGGGQPLVARYRMVSGAAISGRSSQYDFFGPIETAISRATAVLCKGEIVWRDVYTGVVLTQEQIDSFTPCTNSETP